MNNIAHIIKSSSFYFTLSVLECTIWNVFIDHAQIENRFLMGLYCYIVVCHMVDLIIRMVNFSSIVWYHIISAACYFSMLLSAAYFCGWFDMEAMQLIKMLVIFLAIYYCGYKNNQYAENKEADEINRMLRDGVSKN